MKILAALALCLCITAAQADLFDDAEAAYLSENTRYGCASTRYFSTDPPAPEMT